MLFELKKHNKAIWKLRKLIISSKKSRCFIFMNAKTYKEIPPHYTIPNWLLCCTCEHQRCHCNAKFKLDLLCIKEIPYQFDPPINYSNNITIQFIKFTYCTDRFSQEAITTKNENINHCLILLLIEDGK